MAFPVVAGRRIACNPEDLGSVSLDEGDVLGEEMTSVILTGEFCMEERSLQAIIHGPVWSRQQRSN